MKKDYTNNNDMETTTINVETADQIESLNENWMKANNTKREEEASVRTEEEAEGSPPPNISSLSKIYSNNNSPEGRKLTDLSIYKGEKPKNKSDGKG